MQKRKPVSAQEAREKTPQPGGSLAGRLRAVVEGLKRFRLSTMKGVTMERSYDYLDALTDTASLRAELSQAQFDLEVFKAQLAREVARRKRVCAVLRDHARYHVLYAGLFFGTENENWKLDEQLQRTQAALAEAVECLQSYMDCLLDYEDMEDTEG